MTTPIKGLRDFMPASAKHNRQPAGRELQAGQRTTLDLEPSGNARGLRDQVMLSQLAEQLRATRKDAPADAPRRPIVTLEP